MSEGKNKRIVGAQRMNESAILVEYSDNSSAIYTAAQLSGLIPIEFQAGNEIEEDEDYPKNVVRFPRGPHLRPVRES
jgi:hypothetical protein